MKALQLKGVECLNPYRNPIHEAHSYNNRALRVLGGCHLQRKHGYHRHGRCRCAAVVEHECGKQKEGVSRKCSKLRSSVPQALLVATIPLAITWAI